MNGLKNMSYVSLYTHIYKCVYMYRRYIYIYIHTYNRKYAALRKKAILLFSTPWISLEDIMVCKIYLGQKHRYCMILLRCVI
jgi:hypothetical protein